MNYFLSLYVFSNLIYQVFLLIFYNYDRLPSYPIAYHLVMFMNFDRLVFAI